MFCLQNKEAFVVHPSSIPNCPQSSVIHIHKPPIVDGRATFLSLISVAGFGFFFCILINNNKNNKNKKHSFSSNLSIAVMSSLMAPLQMPIPVQFISPSSLSPVNSSNGSPDASSFLLMAAGSPSSTNSSVLVSSSNSSPLPNAVAMANVADGQTSSTTPKQSSVDADRETASSSISSSSAGSTNDHLSIISVKEEEEIVSVVATAANSPILRRPTSNGSRRKVSSTNSSASSNTSSTAGVKRRWEKPEVCLICGQPAQCLNFGAHCCHACRMFFRRSVLNLREFACKFDGNCDTTKGKNCRACRFDSCVLAELDISLIQFPPDFDVPGLKQRLEGKRKELRQKREEQAAKIFTNGIEKSFSSIIELVEFNKCLDHLMLAEKQAAAVRYSPNNLVLEYLCGKSLADLLTSQMNVLNFVELFTMNGAPLKCAAMEVEGRDLPFIGNYLNLDMLLNIELMRTLPVFDELSLDDKICLFRHNIHKLVTLANGFYSFRMNADTVVYPNQAMPANLCRNALERELTDEKLRRYTNLRKRAFNDVMDEFKAVNLSTEEFVLLRAIFFCNTVPQECSGQAKCFLQSEAERYGRCLLRHLQLKLGELPGAQKYAECLLFATKIFDYNRRQGKLYQLVDQLVFGLDPAQGPNPAHPPFVFECLMQQTFVSAANDVLLLPS